MSQFLLHTHSHALPPSPRKTQARLLKFAHNSYFWVGLLASFTLIRLLFSNWNPYDSQCSVVSDGFTGSNFSNSLLPSHEFSPNLTEEEQDFWKQPDDLGFRPCLKFSREYKEASLSVVRERRRFLMVVVSGGLNQQRNQIVDVVVIARILEAVLVVPILQVNVIWGDESEFSDIFDVEHFKTCLKDDVKIVSSLPSTHLMSKPVEEKKTPLHVSPRWIRSRYLDQLNRQGVLLMRGLDSRLSKDLPPDLQKLRCKVAFEALRFAAPIQNIGNKLAQRMWKAGPYIALHLRLEKDVWVRSGCLPGLAPHYDRIVQQERKTHPHLLTARSTMTYQQRKLAGLCPLNAMEVARLLKALGVPEKSHIYWAGGNPLGGKLALEALVNEFPNLYNKESVAQAGELEAFSSRPSHLAAIDYIVALNSDVFMASHGGNMGRAIQGHRAYRGLRKNITPNKRRILPYLQDMTLSEGELKSIVRTWLAHSRIWGTTANY
ncbi:hypothetical protein SUGI_0426450 [Cryptomeria japonica]|nr:hypothetical protein SUGI_0426450 [Cryptomeria japonica]